MVRPLRSGVFVIGHVGEVACGPEQFLPTVHLTGKRILHPRTRCASSAKLVMIADT
jgi:hypothetical protein